MVLQDRGSRHGELEEVWEKLGDYLGIHRKSSQVGLRLFPCPYLFNVEQQEENSHPRQEK